MGSKQSSRAFLAGQLLGKAITEMVNLMYQENTARNFMSGLLTVIAKTHKYFHKKEEEKNDISEITIQDNFCTCDVRGCNKKAIWMTSNGQFCEDHG